MMLISASFPRTVRMREVYFCRSVILYLREFCEFTSIIASNCLNNLAEFSTIVFLYVSNTFFNSKGRFTGYLQCDILACYTFHKSQYHVVTLAFASYNGIYLLMTEFIAFIHIRIPLVYAAPHMLQFFLYAAGCSTSSYL